MTAPSASPHVHLVVDDDCAVIEVHAGAEVASIRVVRNSAETVSEYFARLALLAQLSPRQLAGVAHRSTEARRRIAAGAGRAGDVQAAQANAYLTTERADAARAEQEARDLASRLFSEDDASTD